MIQLRSVTKKYKNNYALKNINLDILSGEFVFITGASGAGKSTLIKMLYKEETPTTGTVLIGGINIANLPPEKVPNLRRCMGIVFQDYKLLQNQSVYDNIAFGLKMRKYDKKTIDAKVREVAESLNLTELLNRKPKQLSGGQRQRVALGRAIVRNPKVFLMDEPLSNLDANLRVHMRSEIKRLHQKLKTTFIYVTHAQTAAWTMGDRIVVLDKVKIQQADTPEVIYNQPKNKFVAGFIGQMNFVDTVVHNGYFEIEGHGFKTDKNIEGEVTVAIRAEKMIAGDVSIKVKPEIIEMTGGERIVYFNLNGSKCSARVPLDYPIGENIELKISVEDMYFFDKESGDVI